MSDFDRIEEHRELVAGLEYDEWAERMSAKDESEDDGEAHMLLDRLERLEANLPKATA